MTRLPDRLPIESAEPAVGGEFPIKRQSESETDRDNVAARRGDREKPEELRMLRRVARVLRKYSIWDELTPLRGTRRAVA